MEKKPKQRRGFAAMSLEKRTAIARKGGASVPGEKRIFARDKDLAITSGSKGGLASGAAKRKRMKEQP